MSNDRPPRQATSVLRARFVIPPKIGGEELQAWRADQHKKHTCEAQQAGLVFTPTTAGEAVEIVVPWANVVSYDRGPRS